MSNNLWNEIFLLKRYKLIKFFMFNPTFCNYLKKMYILYKKDLRCDFISLPIGHKFELNIRNEFIEMFKSFILTDVYFVKRFTKLLKNFSNWPPQYNGRGSYLKWMTNFKRKNQLKFNQYIKLFEQIANYMFKRYIELGFPISTLDKIMYSLEVELPIRFFIVAAFFQFILYQYSQNKNLTSLHNIKIPKMKYRRSSV